MRTVAVMLLTLGTVSASAQYYYYMNVVQKNGEKFQYLVSKIDSVYFSAVNYEYVDLGLSVKWATCNVGATRPEEFGDYFSWGETEPKDDYSWSAYKWCNGSINTLTKYCDNSNYGNEGFTDMLTVLNPEDDVAHVKWGGSWRMPTEAEMEDLSTKCTWRWYVEGNSEFGGVAGHKITSNIAGYEDRFIFLPAAGYRYNSNISSVGYYGYYWCNSLRTDRQGHARSLYYYSHYRNPNYCDERNSGLTVRPVCP